MIAPVLRAVPATVRAASPAGDAIRVSCHARWLVARFAIEHATASWAIVGGGLRTASSPSLVWTGSALASPRRATADGKAGPARAVSRPG